MIDFGREETKSTEERSIGFSDEGEFQFPQNGFYSCFKMDFPVVIFSWFTIACAKADFSRWSKNHNSEVRVLPEGIQNVPRNVRKTNRGVAGVGTVVVEYPSSTCSVLAKEQPLSRAMPLPKLVGASSSSFMPSNPNSNGANNCNPVPFESRPVVMYWRNAQRPLPLSPILR